MQNNRTIHNVPTIKMALLLPLVIAAMLFLTFASMMVQTHSSAAGMVRQSSGNSSSKQIANLHAAQVAQTTPDTAWELLDLSTQPSPRAAYAMAYDEFNYRLLFFGGVCNPSTGGSCNDTWEYSAANGWRQLTPPRSPSVRSSATLVHDTLRNRFVLFGGHVCCVYMNDTWEYTGSTWTPITTANSPLSRGSHAAVYDPSRGKTIIFGGWRNSQTGNDILNDTWEYDGVNWKQILTNNSPSRRTGAQMVYAPELGGVILFGGTGCNSYCNDLWKYDGSDWMPITTTTKPEGRYYHQLAYDWQREVLVLFGGYNASQKRAMTDTWEYDGNDWYQVSPPVSPPGTWASRAIYYPPQAGVILFGGNSPLQNYLQNYTWLYKVQGTSSYTLSGKIVDDYDQPAPNVEVQYKGKRSVRTDQNGNYSIPYLPQGFYAILPVESAESIFSPPTHIVELNQNITDTNFLRRPVAEPFLSSPVYPDKPIFEALKSLKNGGPLISWFDHSAPNYSENSTITLYDGEEHPDLPNKCIDYPDKYTCYDGHDGIDLDDGAKTEYAYAAGDGVVHLIQTDSSKAYGKYVVIDHRNGYATLYGHLDSIDDSLSQGITVTTGMTVGQIGCTGLTGVDGCPTHLHFGVYFDHNGNKTWSVVDSSESKKSAEVVDPFGWCSGKTDPWTVSGGWHSTNLWKDYSLCPEVELTETARIVSNVAQDIIAHIPAYAVDSPAKFMLLEAPPIASTTNLPLSLRYIGKSFFILMEKLQGSVSNVSTQNTILATNVLSDTPQFSQPITVTIRYSDQALRHYDPLSLAVVHRNDKVGNWEVKPPIEKGPNEISILTQKTGNYLLAGNLLCSVEPSEPNDLDILSDELTVNTESGIHVFDHAADVDWFKVNVNANTKYELTMLEVADGITPTAEIFAPNGITPLYVELNNWTPDQTDTYYVKVTNGSGDNFGCDASYRIRLSEIRPATPTPTFTPTITSTPATPTATPVPILSAPQLNQPDDNITVEEDTKLTYQWQPVANAASYEFVQTRNPGGDSPSDTRITVTEPKYTDDAGVIPGSYSWAVKAVSAEGAESAVNRRFFLVAPHNPTNVQATALSCQTIKVTWDDNSAFEQGYQIYRNGVKIADTEALNGGSGEYEDTGRTPSASYEYKVIAYHAAATLGGATKSVVTPACPENTFALTTNTDGNGTVTATPTGPYTSGSQVQLTAKPDDGWHFVKWESSVDLGNQSTQPVITVTVTDNVTYTAYFEANAPDTFTLTTNVVGNGSVSVNPSGPYTSGAQVQLTAMPDDGWRFVRWESSQAALGEQATESTIMLTVTADATYTAHFSQVEPPPSNEMYLPLIKN